MRSHKIISLFVISIIYINASSQPGGSGQSTAVDSLKAKLQNAKTVEEKFYYTDNLSRVMMNVDMIKGDSLGNDLIRIAEESRDRKLMVDAYLSNGVRCSYLRGQKRFIDRAIDYFNKALDLARENKLQSKVGEAQLRLAVMYLAIPDKDKALSFANQAFSLISTLKDDSLQVESYNAYGQVYLVRNEKTVALRNFLTALSKAEEIKPGNKAEKNRKSILLRNCYGLLSDFYKDIGAYDKAIDYKTLAYKKLDDIEDKSVPYQRVIDVSSLGNLYSAKKNYDLAITYYERSVAMADSLKFITLKIPGYISLLNQYLQLEQPEKALAFMNSSGGQAIKTYMTNFGLSAITDQVYAVIYTERGTFDSAAIYFAKATPYFEQSTNENSKMNYYLNMALFYQRTKNATKAIEFLQKVKEMAERLGVLEVIRMTAKNLDTLYANKGDYKQASIYNGIYYTYKDSIEKMNKERSITQIEAADEQQRQERIAKEKEDAKKKRYHIQYFAITIGIAALFILLVMMGMFRVSVNTIKAIGFFVFLMLFEFIFLVFKKNITGITHGEPWKDLAFMIGLAALLLPLHHWLEHSVIKYLTSHNRLTNAGYHIKSKLLRRVKIEKNEET